ncbi:MAG: nucleotidyltransferase family protein [Desulfurobacteriaceae bacterium]
MSELERVVAVLKEHKGKLRVDFGVKEIGIFGSVVRGELKEDSDIDILVEFEKPIGLLRFIELEDFLSRLIGRKVDLVSKKALKPYIGKHILKEVLII